MYSWGRGMGEGVSDLYIKGIVVGPTCLVYVYAMEMTACEIVTQ